MAGFVVTFLLYRYILQVVTFGSETEQDLFKIFIIHGMAIESQQNYEVRINLDIIKECFHKCGKFTPILLLCSFKLIHYFFETNLLFILGNALLFHFSIISFRAA